MSVCKKLPADFEEKLVIDWTSKNEQLLPEANRKCQGTLQCCHSIDDVRTHLMMMKT
jgi:hypothetical protein